MTIHPQNADLPHYVYACYGKDGRLLYVGCARDVGRRTWEHLRQRGWWEEVDSVRVLDSLPNRAEGLAIERLRITEMRPAYNQMRYVPVPQWDLADYLGFIAGHLKRHWNATLRLRDVTYLREVRIRFGVDLPHGREALLAEIDRLLTSVPSKDAA